MDLEDWSTRLKVFADATRVRLLALLEGEELTVAELSAITRLAQPRVSTHLARLKEAGLVRDRRAGVSAYYRFDEAQLDAAQRALWHALKSGSDDPLLRQDAERVAGVLASRAAEQNWADTVAGDMERHYSPGRTWEALARSALPLLEPGDVLLHRFSPTGFYSSAVRNPFLRNLEARSERQIPYSKVEAGEHTVRLDVGVKGKNFWVAPKDLDRARAWSAQGFTDGLRTPDDTIIFVNPAERDEIRKDQADCMGCLSHCGFSSWKDHDDYTTGRLADPRSFCIQKTLQDIAHGGPVDDNLMFAGHAAYKFKQDPFYSNGFTPTVKELVDRILTGD